MVSTPVRDPAKSSMDPASVSKECPKPCSRLHSEFFGAAQEYLQRCGHESQHRGRTVARFLRGLARQREAANVTAFMKDSEAYCSWSGEARCPVISSIRML
jgi:hypothetical protein